MTELKLVVLGLILVVLPYSVYEISGHGMMLEPPNRSSLWRFDDSAPPNYDDNQNYCGGLSVQWDIFDGKCGLCGDRYDDPRPQANENTGTYGTGKVVRTYNQGSVVDVNVLLTKNHNGNFKFAVCVLSDFDAPESGEQCFQEVALEDGSDQYDVNSDEKSIDLRLQLPQGLTCERCVLRWHYTAGNNWNDCGNGTSARGCGPQETFRSCADISII